MTTFFQKTMCLSRARYVFDLEDRFARGFGLKGPHPRPFGAVKFYALPQDGGDPCQDTSSRLELVMQRNRSGYHLFFDLIRLPDGSQRQFLTGFEPVSPGEKRRFLASGVYTVCVESQFYQPIDVEITLPRVDLEQIDCTEEVPPDLDLTAFDLLPNEAYPFPKTSTRHSSGIPTLLLGRVLDANGKALMGVIVKTVRDLVVDPERRIEREIVDQTDQSGQWMLSFPDELFSEATPQLEVTIGFSLSDQPDVLVKEVTETIRWGRLKKRPPDGLNS